MFNSIEVRTADGVSLAARLYAAEGADVGAVLIVPAMGVPQDFYGRFATWLARQGYSTMTFDYRGSGASRTRSLRRESADVVTWGERDVTAALAALRERAGSLPITWIGHSLGGQVVPFVPNHTEVDKIITIAAGSGYWRHNAPALKRKVWFFWWGAVPVATTLFGYFPGRRLGMVGDLPRGVIWQWRKWCMDPNYAVGAEGSAMASRFAGVTTPITSLSFTDDEMMSEQSIAVLHSHYTGAPRTMRRFSPKDLGLRRVGHFGFFRPEMEEPLWRKVIVGELSRDRATRVGRPLEQRDTPPQPAVDK